jgi:hypothetical protein
LEKELVEKYKSAGFDDEAALLIARDFAKYAGQNKSPERDVIGEELEDLILESDFYDDAKAYEKEIRAEIVKSNGALDVKAAYVRVRDPSARAMEIANRNKATPASLKAQPVSRPSAPTGDALSETEREELATLKQIFPFQKWDANSYRTYKRNK